MVGAYFGEPQLGFVLGSLAGAALFPTQLPSGPKISDNRTTSASVGGPVSIVFGTADVAGTVIWLAPYVQTANESGSKGGPQQTTYQYNQSIAIGLCEPIGNLLRVWENGTIVYDIRPQQAANTDLNLLAETDLEYSNRLTVSAIYAETFVLYTGSETQEADPTIESIEGYGNVPAFRSLAYIVYPNRLLQATQGWRHPTFRFEVSAQGTGECETVTQYSNEVLYPWVGGDGDPTNPNNSNSFHIESWDAAAPNSVAWPGEANSYPSLADALGYIAPAFNGSPYNIFVGYNLTNPDGTVATLAQAGGPALAGAHLNPDPARVTLHFNCRLVSTYSSALHAGMMSNRGDVLWANSAVYEVLGPWTGYPQVPSPVVAPWNAVSANAAYGTNEWYVSADTQIVVNRAPAAPLPPCAGLTRWAQDTDYAVQADGTLIKCAVWAQDTTQRYYVLQATQLSQAGVCIYPQSPALPESSPDNTEAFWTAAYAAAPAGSMRAGMTFSLAGGANCYPVLQDFGYRIDSTICEGAGGGASVSSIIQAVCARAGLLAIDAADMAGVSIPGYAVSSISSASAILTPLRSVAFFDAIETQGVMKFAARGKPVVATLTTDDIGAYDESGGGHKSVPPSVSTVRAQDEDLPRSVRLKYKAVARDYEEGEQDSPFRLATRAVNDVDVSLALCLGDVQAAQCAEVLWADAWAARTAYTVSVDQAWLALDCGDCIGVPVDRVIQRLRIVTDSNASGVLRKLSCVRDDGGAYISFAVASPPQRPAQVLSFIGPSSYEMLDLPCLVDADSDPGFYLAAQRQSGGGKWNGCLAYQSLDGGVTYTQLFALVTEASMGTLAAPLAAGDPYTWDMANTIAVAVANETITFESRTDAAVIAGANAAALGADGRWEIVQFATATQVSATRWTLSRLLRGRRGTEHVMGSSVSGDTLVMVSTGDLQRQVLEQSQVGAALGYKVVSLGASYASGVNQSFAGHAEALIPFSPVALAAAGQASGDVLITWTRRGRLGRTLTSGADIPLSEATEAYQVDILSAATPPAVLRTLAVTAPAATYTAEAQLADGGALLSAPITIAVYQLSAIVGRGTPAVATLGIGGVTSPLRRYALAITFLAAPPPDLDGTLDFELTYTPPSGGGAPVTQGIALSSGVAPKDPITGERLNLAAYPAAFAASVNTAFHGFVTAIVNPADVMQLLLQCEVGATVSGPDPTANPQYYQYSFIHLWLTAPAA